jgi:hypothetical protein
MPGVVGTRNPGADQPYGSRIDSGWRRALDPVGWKK